MTVTLLEAIHYPPGREWRSLKTEVPDWGCIEAAIRRLDRDEWPFVWLHTEPPVKFEFPNNMFCVMGGRGEYGLTLYKDGDEISLFDPSRSGEDEMIRIWESDQGCECWATNLCNDLALTLALTRTFCETGNLDERCRWRVD
jgi:hypothetical protein